MKKTVCSVGAVHILTWVRNATVGRQIDVRGGLCGISALFDCSGVFDVRTHRRGKSFEITGNVCVYVNKKWVNKDRK